MTLRLFCDQCQREPKLDDDGLYRVITVDRQCNFVDNEHVPGYSAHLCSTQCLADWAIWHST